MNSHRLFRRLFVPDSHWPWADQKAWNLMSQVAEVFRPDEIVILGDFQDCYGVSEYGKNPDHTFLQLKDELKLGIQKMRELEARSACRKVVYLEGNHERRIPRYMANHASPLFSHMNTRDVLGIPKHYAYLPYGQGNHYKMGGLVATHGKLINKHVGAAMLAKYKTNVIFGHTHRMSEIHTKTFDGRVLRAYNSGWLGDVRHAAEYIEDMDDWTLGFTLGWFKPKSDNFFIQLVPILNYELVYDNKLFTGGGR